MCPGFTTSCAFVLAVLVVHDDDHLSTTDVVDRLADRREGTSRCDHSRSFRGQTLHVGHEIKSREPVTPF